MCDKVDLLSTISEINKIIFQEFNIENLFVYDFPNNKLKLIVPKETQIELNSLLQNILKFSELS